jgi:hypothetical protein
MKLEHQHSTMCFMIATLVAAGGACAQSGDDAFARLPTTVEETQVHAISLPIPIQLYLASGASCSATIVSRRDVQTTARCFDATGRSECQLQRKTGVKVTINGRDYTGNAVLHPCFNGTDNDTAILNLSTDIQDTGT